MRLVVAARIGDLWRRIFPPAPRVPVCSAEPWSIEWLEHQVRFSPSPYVRLAASKTLARHYHRKLQEDMFRRVVREELARQRRTDRDNESGNS